ncbi:MAG: response regulator [Anaerolineales bacterium]|nr:MAG: response regulator [Anaerolineales bacterium]
MARVLIVDDQAATVELLSATLRILGHEPISAYNGEQALDLIAVHNPDIILLDMMMPGITGLETLRRLRTTPGLGQIPVIVVSAGQEFDLKDRLQEAGGAVLLPKPTSMDQLQQKIDECLNHESNG